MKVIITGASGYIGRNLILGLEREPYEIATLRRNSLNQPDKLLKEIAGADVVIHLAGAPILTRWTKAAKNEIMTSRTITTQYLVKAINQLPDRDKPGLLISASAIGIYTANEKHTEESRLFADNFIGKVVQSWESSSDELDKSVRRVIFRIGLVLGPDAQIIRKLVPVFKLGLGGKIGSGEQPFPFVHIQDVAQAFKWAIGQTDARGIYNLVSPEQITNTDFTKTLAKLLSRPAWFTVPAFAIKSVYGGASSLILQNPAVYPERLIKSGFAFTFPDIKSSLSDCIKKPR